MLATCTVVGAQRVARDEDVRAGGDDQVSQVAPTARRKTNERWSKSGVLAIRSGPRASKGVRTGAIIERGDDRLERRAEVAVVVVKNDTEAHGEAEDRDE